MSGTNRIEKSVARAILTDAQFWMPFLVLLLGLVVLAVCAKG